MKENWKNSIFTFKIRYYLKKKKIEIKNYDSLKTDKSL